SDAKVVTKKELIIILKFKLIPTLSERVQMLKSPVNPIQKRLEENQKQLKFYQLSPDDKK
ncbi:MAG: hypothetical protein N3A61_03205, partial [Ignavibacteria bacterium]|nr:hypothetical protein [Ignavibacteria bacterium]